MERDSAPYRIFQDFKSLCSYWCCWCRRKYQERSNTAGREQRPNVVHHINTISNPLANEQHIYDDTGDPANVPETVTKTSETYVVALYDYTAREPDDLSFIKGERLLVIDTNENKDWWKLQSTTTHYVGYGPANYVVPEESLDQKAWYFGKIGKDEARRLLMDRGNEIGTFLVRDSITYEGEYALSVLIFNNKDAKKDVVTYRIMCNPEREYYIRKGIDFADISELVDHYKTNSEELPYRLDRPCPISYQPVTLSLAKDVFEVERSTITLGTVIGKGAFGEVRIGRWRDATEVAVKMLTPGTMAPEEFLSEAERMKNLRHQNLLRLLAVVSEEPIYIVTEYMPNGSLLRYLRVGDGQHSDTEHHTEMATQIASGMYYLEAMNYIHRDLRAANVLVGRRGTYKIADFGLARLIKDDEYRASSGAKFPVKWSAPECITHRKFTVKSDVWSFGVLLYEIVTRGRIPYADIQNEDVLARLESGYRMPMPVGCPEKFYEVMLQCWDREPVRRPSFAFLQEVFIDGHTYGTQINIS